MKVNRDAIKVLAVILLSLFGLDLLAVFFGPARPAVFYVPTASAQTQTRILPPDAVVEASRAVVILRLLINPDVLLNGSGWFADDTTMVTTAHVFGSTKIKRGEIVWHNFIQWRTFPFYSIQAIITLVHFHSPRDSLLKNKYEHERIMPFMYRDIGADVGLVMISREGAKDSPSAFVRAEAPYLGEKVWWACANRKDEWFSGMFIYEQLPTASDRPIEGYPGWKYEFPVYVFYPEKGGLYGGCSGAPVFDKQGRVVGMLSSAIKDKSGYAMWAIIIRGQDIARVLEKIQVRTTPNEAIIPKSVAKTLSAP